MSAGCEHRDPVRRQRPEPAGLANHPRPGNDILGGGVVADDDTGQTSREGVFAGGDIVTGSATVILAAGAGKRSAKAIDAYLSEKHGERLQ